MTTGTNLLRHLLATLAYRFQYAARDAPAGFSEFNAGNGVPTPLDLVRHLNGLLTFVASCFREDERQDVQSLDWGESIQVFHDLLSSIDQSLEAGLSPKETTLEVLLQGPLSDALTHIGQLALLRRMAGSPVMKGNFRMAKIRIGKVGIVQEME